MIKFEKLDHVTSCVSCITAEPEANLALRIEFVSIPLCDTCIKALQKQVTEYLDTGEVISVMDFFK